MPKVSANLDFLRSWAVLTVYVAHLHQMMGLPDWWNISSNAVAQTGVLIFFVHTTLVLMYSMERLALPAAALIPSFYLRRAFRIYPLSIVTVVAIFAFSIPPFPTRDFVPLSRMDWISNLLLIQNLTFSPESLGPLWSLPYEVQMYLALPFLYLLVRAVPKWWVPAGLWVLAVVVAPFQKEVSARLSLFQYGPCFLGGLLAYVLARRPALRLPWWGLPLTILAAMAIRQAGFQAGWGACLLLGAALPQFREMDHPVLCRLAAWIAKYSYGIYLSHVVIFWLAFVVLRPWPGWAKWSLCAVLSVVLPVLMFHLVEQPAIGAGVRLANRFWPKTSGRAA